MKTKFLIICLLLINSFFGQNSDSLALSVKVKWNNMPLIIDSEYISKNNDTLKISQLSFYLSNIKLVFDDESVFKDNKSHLVQLKDLNSLNIPICKKNKKIKTITFSIGVDSLASVSGALAGHLDPSKGMYWTWQSGYINMKIEGKSSSCKTRKNAFLFHIGGYLAPNYALRNVTLYPKSENLELEMNLAKLFENLLLSETNSVMIPGIKAMELADYSVKMFTIK
jgi:hypothetical protein